MIQIQIHGRKLTIVNAIRWLRGGVNSIVSFALRKPSFKEYHMSDVIKSPIILTPQFIELGENVYIGHHARIQGIKSYNGDSFQPLIKLNDGVSIQQNIHLTCASSIVIGKNTAMEMRIEEKKRAEKGGEGSDKKQRREKTRLLLNLIQCCL